MDLFKKKLFDCSKCKKLFRRKPQRVIKTVSYNPPQMSPKDYVFSSFNKGDPFEANKIYEQLTIEHLIILLLDLDIQTDELFRFSFFLSSRVFISSNELLKLLFSKTIQLINETKDKETINAYYNKFLVILKEWTQNFPNDFRHSKTWAEFFKIREKCSKYDESLKETLDNIAVYLESKSKNINDYEEYLKLIHTELQAKASNRNAKIPEITINQICPDPKELAYQLTHIELDRLSHIGPDEFIDKTFASSFEQVSALNEPRTKKYGMKTVTDLKADLKKCSQDDNIFISKSTERKYMKPAANLEAYEIWTNRLYSFVSNEIIKVRENKRRIEIVEYFIDCSDECYRIGNYNSGFQIINAIESSAHINRLIKTTLSKLSEVSQKKKGLLVHKSSVNNSYAFYRSLLKQTSPEKLCKVPIFSIFSKDIYNLIDNKLKKESDRRGYSFKGFWDISKYILENLSEKTRPLKKEVNNEVINYLLTSPILQEEAQEYLSYLIEAPDKAKRLIELKEKLFGN